MNERRIHQVFEISVLLKGAHAVIECLGGLLLALIGNDWIRSHVASLTQYELVEDPRDMIANALLGFAQQFSVGSQHFYALYLLSHGIVKLLLVIGLLRGKLWAYPASLAALGLFMGLSALPLQLCAQSRSDCSDRLRCRCDGAGLARVPPGETTAAPRLVTFKPP